MRCRIVLSLLTVIALGLTVSPGPAAAEAFGGVDFPQGAASFADEVVSYQPIANGFSLSPSVVRPDQALGPPNFESGVEGFVSLGNGGSITLRFVDNALTGSGNANKDLWIFEIGPLVENTNVAISQDGSTWTSVGTILGSTRGVDIDAFVSDPTVQFSYVRLTDVSTNNFSTGSTAGADIDAVGAISTVLIPTDTTPPAVAVPADITAEAIGPGGAPVAFDASASDLVDGALTPGCLPASGTLFPLGTTTVTCTASDAAGNTGDASFAVTVVDTTPPQITVPADVTAEATSEGGAAVVYDPATAVDLVDTTVTPTCAPASGSTFPIGTSTVVCTATDAEGNTGSTGFHVTVGDTTAPALMLPDPLEAEATSATGAAVAFDATALDIVDGPVAPACDPPSGATFPLGETAVGCTAADAAGNTASGSFSVTVVDSTAPALTVPADFAVEATGPAGAAVGYDASAFDVVDGAVVPACAPPSGEIFPLGTTAVDCTAADAAGNSAIAGFAVTVVDSTPPTVTVPAGFTVDATSPAGAVVEFSASAADLVDGALPVVCSAASGNTFPVGATTVTCGATDAAGNQGGASFVVTVVAPAYSVCPLFDQSKAVKAGAVKPIRVQLCDAAGNNLSSPEIVLYAAGLVHVDGTPSAQVEDPGQSNPDHNFRYDDGAYTFNLDTAGLTSGTWKLLFTVNGYATVYEVTFDVR